MEERYLIHAGFVAKLPFAEIADGIGRDRSVIDDERDRGCDSRGRYCPHRAQLKEAKVSFQAIYAAVGQNNWSRWLYTALIRRHLKRPARRPYSGAAQSIHERAKAGATVVAAMAIDQLPG